MPIKNIQFGGNCPKIAMFKHSFFWIDSLSPQRCKR
jgi:hypothetical protein